MSDQIPDAKAVVPELTYEQRKKALIAQGAARRNDIDKSIDIVRNNLHADRLAKSAVNHLTSAAYTTVENMFDWRGIKNGNLRNLLPLAASAYSIISRRRLLLPLLKGATVVAGLGAGGYFLWQRKQRAKAASIERLNYPEYADPGM